MIRKMKFPKKKALCPGEYGERSDCFTKNVPNDNRHCEKGVLCPTKQSILLTSAETASQSSLAVTGSFGCRFELNGDLVPWICS